MKTKFESEGPNDKKGNGRKNLRCVLLGLAHNSNMSKGSARAVQILHCHAIISIES